MRIQQKWRNKIQYHEHDQKHERLKKTAYKYLVFKEKVVMELVLNYYKQTESSLT